MYPYMCIRFQLISQDFILRQSQQAAEWKYSAGVESVADFWVDFSFSNRMLIIILRQSAQKKNNQFLNEIDVNVWRHDS